ncbi:MAG: type II secretion system protein GspG [Fimbriimonadaceae bacterium]|nr:type II secretion system protein GspG [Fimbriimonadaceae bacterium]
MLVALSIVGILLALATPAWLQRTRLERENALRRDLEAIRSAVRQYRADCGVWPSTLAKLTDAGGPCSGYDDAGVSAKNGSGNFRGPYLPAVPKDAVSGAAFQYFPIGPPGRGEVLSSASGSDADGVAFSNY